MHAQGKQASCFAISVCSGNHSAHHRSALDRNLIYSRFRRMHTERHVQSVAFLGDRLVLGTLEGELRVCCIGTWLCDILVLRCDLLFKFQQVRLLPGLLQYLLA